MISALKYANSKTSAKNRSTDDPGHLVVSTRFMESYELVKPVSGGGDLTTFLNLSGGLDIYSVGTDGKVYRTRNNSESSEGWLNDDLKISATQLFVAAPDDPTDNPEIFGLNNYGYLTQSVYQSGSYEQKVNQPPKSTTKINQFKAASNIGNIYCNVILESNEIATNFLQRDGTWASPSWGLMKVTGSNETVKAKRIAMCSNNQVQTSLYAIDMDDEVIFAENSSRFTQFQKLNKKAIDLSIVLDSENRLNIIVIDTAFKLWSKREKKYSSGGGIEWEDWVPLNGEGVVSLQAVQSAMDANGNANEGLLEVFAIGKDSSLYHIRQVQAGRNVEWGTLFPLGTPINATGFTVGKNEQGYSELYSVTSESDLYRFWQAPNTTQWTTTRIELQEATETTPLACHSVQIQVLDESGLQVPNTEIKISTSNLTTLRINGLYYHVSEYLPFTMPLDGAGTIMVERFTNMLAAPTLFIETDFMTNGEGITVEPNANLQDRLHQTTAEQVLDARGVDGEHLLKGDERTEENAESIANIMRQSMSLGFPQSDNGPERYLSMNRVQTGLRFHQRGTTEPFRINPAEVEEQHWRVDMSSGFPRYETLDRATAAQYVSDRRLAMEAQGFLGIDWGDLWQSIKEGVSSIISGIKDFVVTTIIDPITGLVKEIKVIFEIIVDGISQFIDTTIEFFQQAFDIVEGIWNKIKVFFEDLYHWLRFLFEWKDIQKTADAITHSLNVTMDFLVEVIKYERQKVLEGLNALEDKVQSSVDSFLESFGDNTTLGEYTTEQTEPEPTLDVATSHNVLYSGFMDNWKNTDIKPGAVNLTSITQMESFGLLEEAFNKLDELANNFQFGAGKDAFDEAVAYLKEIGENPNEIVNLLFKAMVKVGEAIALFGLAVVRGVILSIFDVLIDIILGIKSLLNEEWEIPFISQLYKWITDGKTLGFSPIGLMSLMMAAPTTVAYKIAFDKAPFNDASLAEFKNGFTVAWLCKQSGLPTTDQLIAAEVTNDQIKLWRQIFSWSYASLFVLRELEAVQVGFAVAKGSSFKPLNIAIIVLRLGNSAFSAPWVMKDKAGGFDCSANGFSNWIWVCQLVFGPVRGGLLLAFGPAIIKKKYPKFNEEEVAKYASWINNGTLTAWGAIHLIMVVVQAVVEDNPTAISVSKNVLTTLGPQTLRFGAIKEVNTGTYYIPIIALEIFIIFGYPAIATLNVLQYWPEDEEKLMVKREMGFLPIENTSMVC